ncbi:serine hydrolase domain-containing protein [Ilumatobacter sp.]|uniref:serine hydrolase domain-containing protein n=1 Tax=Ilumatobacter sp. TaxID=1967498 RepID=UPI003C6FAFC3
MLRTTADLAAFAVVGTTLAGCVNDGTASSSGQSSATTTTATPTTTTAAPNTASGATGAGSSDALFAELDEKVESAMEEFVVPGVAVAVLHDGHEYVRGYGVCSVDAPVPVDEHTAFRIGSTTKTFTGMAVMRLVEAGEVDLDATVRTYLPEFSVADEAVAERVTVRQLLNHSAGWLGDDLQDFGRGEDAIERYVQSMTRLPQLRPLGSTFFYNNAAVVAAGHLVEKVHGTTYEQAVQDLVLDPLDLDHTRFFTDELVGRTFAGPHIVVDGNAVLDPSLWYLPRSINPAGALISSARDQMSYLRFHLGDGTAADGSRILGASSLETMHSHPGPGGTLLGELDGYALSLMVRPSAEGIPIVQHGGDWAAQHSGFMFVPERNFGIAILTNSTGGHSLREEIFVSDWALSRFAGLHNVPSEPQDKSAEQLAQYLGRYEAEGITLNGDTVTTIIELTADDGRIGIRLVDPDSTVAADEPVDFIALYRDDYAVDLSPEGTPLPTRYNFVRDANGEVDGFLVNGRLHLKIA